MRNKPRELEAVDEAISQLRIRYKDWITPWLDSGKRRYRNGEKSALIATISTCLSFGIEIPAWARDALGDSYRDAPKSWDDVFGRPPKRGAVMQQRRDLEFRVIVRIENLREQGWPVGSDLFDKVGKEFGFSAESVRDSIYYKSPSRPALMVIKAMLKEVGPDADRAGVATWFKQNERRVAEEFLKVLGMDHPAIKDSPHSISKKSRQRFRNTPTR